MTPKHLCTLVLSLTVVLPATAALVAQTNTSMPRSPVTLSRSDTGAVVTTVNHNWTDQQILTCTVSECWHLSGRNEATFFDIVQQLTEISAQHRGLTLPDSDAAGKKMGEMIKQKTKADRGQLLYAVVDEAVRKIGIQAPASNNPK